MAYQKVKQTARRALSSSSACTLDNFDEMGQFLPTVRAQDDLNSPTSIKEIEVVA